MPHGQLQHVFTFIMMIVIAGVVLLLGYMFISRILGTQCETERMSLVTDLRKDLRSYSSYGSIHVVEFPATCGEAELCFVDATSFGKPDAGGIYPGTSIASYANKVIEHEVKSPSMPPNNIFLVDDKGVTAPLQLFGDKIALDNPAQPLCINATGGTFRVGFEGKGLTVLLTDKSS
jgi:hypothetical protein